ncbi:hypothetical protein NYZ21_21260, partial [Acinetobacter baumannii]|nr:hypothetical protein [Acinetobacter baumannii]
MCTPWLLAGRGSPIASGASDRGNGAAPRRPHETTLAQPESAGCQLPKPPARGLACANGLGLVSWPALPSTAPRVHSA